MNKFQLLFYSCKEICIPQLAEYADYVLQKKTGQTRRKTPLYGIKPDLDLENIILTTPFNLDLANLRMVLNQDKKKVLEAAEVILAGRYHPFGGESQPLNFGIQMNQSQHWSEAGDQVDGLDIKWLWEPARFSWAFSLARAWLVNEDERYIRFFWDKFSEFQRLNPVNSAPNWTSAQEVAVRMLTWIMVYTVFHNSSATTRVDKQRLAEAIWQHAARIPSTLGYARSQNNNHLLTESLALIAAGQFFSKTSVQGKNWLKLGFQQFNQGILNQIEADGTYTQHSANYHRMMLQLALLYNSYAHFAHLEIPERVNERLGAATQWLTEHLDPISGRLPNLGHNDGSLLLPLGSQDFRDYRPTAQAASQAFLGEACLPTGAWDELAIWLGLSTNQKNNSRKEIKCTEIHRLVKDGTQVSLRGVQFHGRPAHADQLHVELWWEGYNIAQDAGTFCYNCNPPWQNPFSSTMVHNTICVDDQDQMLKAGKFLWLRQAQAEWLHDREDCLSARHNGYSQAGIIHKRTVQLEDEGNLQVLDLLTLTRKTGLTKVRLHWLLADWKWVLNGQSLTLEKDNRRVEISIHALNQEDASIQLPKDVSLIRAGETLQGELKEPILGWASDTYGEKHPALSFSFLVLTDSNLQIVTEWSLSKTFSRIGI